MKKILLSLIVCWATLQLGAAEPKDALWNTDFPKAQAQAKAENKMLLMEFTGSDWCPPCMMLKKEILSSPEFLTFAKTNLVLVELDFPRNKPQSNALTEANERLQAKYNVEGYPTIIVLDSNGKVISRESGYGAISPKEYVAKLAKLKAK
jgi:protein disulfide-isomerase